MNRREAIGGFLMMMAAADGASGGQGSGTGRWSDAVFTLENGKTTHESFGAVTVYFDGPTEQLKSMVSGSVLLNPGQEPHPPHQHPEEEFMVVGEGHGEFLVGGKTTQVGPGALLYCEGNNEHGVKNTGSVPMRFYYFKWLK